MRPTLPPPRTAKIAAATATLALIGAGTLAVLSPAAATQITPSEPGSPTLVRDSSVQLSIASTAKTYHRSSTSAAFAAQSPTAVALGLTACRGDNPAGTNLSPRDEIVVTGPDGTTVLSATTPVRDLSVAGVLAGGPPASPQPAPSNSNYRGGFPGAGDGFSATLDLAGKPAGIYTVTTTSTNMLRTGGILQGYGTCTVGTPNGTTFTPGPDVTVETFEYRPWQANFSDVLGNGKVNANLDPREFRFSVGSKRSAVYAGTPQSQSFYSYDGSSFPLPSDPVACAGDPSGCLPQNVIPCEPSEGCNPRFMIINKPIKAPDRDALQGVFDLESKAFIAAVTVDGSIRTLFSLGTGGDDSYHTLLRHLGDAAAAQGIDLAQLLATRVEVSNGRNLTSLSLLNGLQIDPSDSPQGITLVTDTTVQAGVILNIHSSLRLSGGACVANAASSSDEVDRYRRNEDNGYIVTKSDALPRVPAAGPLGALVGGPLYHVRGKFTGATAPLVSTSASVIGVDTATDEPNGYPVWVTPFLSGVSTISARTMDFVGTGTWSASETPVGAGCLVVDFLLGTGVAVYNSPVQGSLLETLIEPVVTPTPEVAALLASIDEAVADTVDQVTSLPLVDDVLTQILGLLPLGDVLP